MGQLDVSPQPHLVLVQVSPDTTHVSGGTEHEGLHRLTAGPTGSCLLSLWYSLPMHYTSKAVLVSGPSDTHACNTRNSEGSGNIEGLPELQNEFTVSLGKSQRPCLERKSKKRGQQDGSVGKKLLATNSGNLSLIPRTT